MKRSLFVLLLLVLNACAQSREAPLPGDSVTADGGIILTPPRFSTTGRAEPREALGPIESRLFPAELVMDHQADIALDQAQRDAIAKEVTTTQAELVRLQFELGASKDELVNVLGSARVDEAVAKAKAKEVMARENAIKAAHLAMLVRIKNFLTPAQQDRLRALREAERCSVVDGGH